MRKILLLSLYVFINLVNKKSQINMNENLRLNLVEVAVLEYLKLANAECLCVFSAECNLQVYFRIIEKLVRTLCIVKKFL